MAKIVLTDASITINSVDLSDHFSSVTLEDTADEVEFTGFGSGYREFGQGLKDATVTLTAFQDYATGEVDATLYPLYDSGGTFPVVVKSDSGATSSTNPSYTMVGRLFSYSPIAGAVGEASTTDITIRNGGTAGLIRGTS